MTHAIATSTPLPQTITRRSELVDQIAFERHQPSLGEDEDREGDLDRRAAPVIFLIDRIDEKRPAVLQVGDHHHADDAEDKLATIC